MDLFLEILDLFLKFWTTLKNIQNISIFRINIENQNWTFYEILDLFIKG